MGVGQVKADELVDEVHLEEVIDKELEEKMISKFNAEMDGLDDTEGLVHEMNDLELLSGLAWDDVKNKQ